MTETQQQAAAPRPRSDLAEFVIAKVVGIQRAYVGPGNGKRAAPSLESAATATLARLRRAVSREPGSDSTVWDVAFDGMPSSLVGRTDQPSRGERAVHAALTLYAVHQQSQSEPMHRAGYSIGRSARELADRTGADAAVLRRFQMLGTASSLAEALHHLRGLVTQFRSERVPLDYGRLADDLYWLQEPSVTDRIRLAWGRDYYRVRPAATTPAQSTEIGDLS